MADVTMPRLSDTMSEGTVGRWIKRPGDHVDNGETIAEIETDNATMDLMAFESSTLQAILVPAGQTVRIGQPIARIGVEPVDHRVSDGATAARYLQELKRLLQSSMRLIV
jgi:pyruvate dehydrogenase E2 component (dihydrolipoamide acetyltransferase)